MDNLVKVEELSQIKRRLSISVPTEHVEKKMDEFFEEARKHVHMDGFRKGKVPVSLLRMQFRDKAYAAVSQGLLIEFYGKAVKELNLTPVGNPVLEGLTADAKYPGEFSLNNEYSVNLLVEVLPNVDPVGYTEMDLDLGSTVDKNKLIDQKLTEYREQFAEHKQITDRPVELGDTLVVDFKGFVNNAPFDGGSANGFIIDKLGSANFVGTFEQQMVGMVVGETRVINIKFPEEYGAAHLAGKDAMFNVTVHSAVKKTPAEVNDDLALMVGYQNTQELMQNIEQEIDKVVLNRQRVDLENQIAKKLLDINSFEVPAALVNGEVQRLKNTIKAETLPPKIEEALRNTANLNVRKAILFDAIYNKEQSLEITPEELDSELDNQAKINNKSKDDIVSLLYNTNQMDSFLATLRSKKAVEFVISNAKKH